MGDGTTENPYTREDVLKAIEKNGGTAEGLDLSGKVFEKGVDLKGLGLQRIILRETVLQDAHCEGAKLWGAHLEEADLQYAYLEEVELPEAYLQEANLLGAYLERASLFRAHLEGADLSTTHLEGADFRGAHLKGVHLWGARFSSDTDWENVDWGDYILADERELRETKGEEREECLARWATDNIYRRLKIWYTNAGVYDIAGEFFFREMEAKRKSMNWRPQPWHKGWLNIYSFISGHGERPLRVVRWAILWIFGLALIYFLIGATWSLLAFWNSFYFSMVSFTALGYGIWLEMNNNWIRGIGAFESFMGVFTMALFLVTFTRKMRR